MRAVQLVLVTVAVALCFLSTVFYGDATHVDIPIGLLIAVTGINSANPSAPSATAAEVGAAAFMAFADINRYTAAKKNNDAVALAAAAALAPLDLSYLDQDFSMVGILNDTTSYPSQGLVAALLQLQEFHVSGVVGTTFSTVCESIGTLMSIFDVPMVSYACGTAALSDRTTYSTFFRTVPSDLYEAHALAHIVASYGWANIAVISTEDASAFGLAQEFELVATSLGIKVLTAAVFTYNSHYADAEQAVIQVMNSGARIILMTALDNDALHAFQAAAKFGMLSDDYVWIGSGGLAGVGTFEGNTTLAAMVRGMIVTSAYTGLGLPQYTNFMNKWHNETVTDFPELAGILTQSIFSKTPTSHCTQAYDAALMYAVAANRILKHQALTGQPSVINSSLLITEFQKPDFNFTGVSGAVYFLNGDRQSSYLVNQLSQDGSTFVNLGIIAGNSFIGSDIISKTIFHSGTNTIPADLPPPIPQVEVKVSDAAIVVVNVFMAIEALWVIMCIAFTLVHSKRYAVKASSPAFLLIICFGVLVGLVAVPLLSVNSDNLCRSYPFVIGMSVVIIFAALFVKTNRIAIIFNQKFQVHSQHLRDSRLLYYVLAVVLAELAFNLCWALINPDSQHHLSSDTSNEYFVGCGGGTNYSNWLIASYAYKGAALLWGVRLAMQVRGVYTPFNESKYVISCILVMAFSCAILPPAFYTSHDPTVRFVLECLWILLLGAYIPSAMFVPKMIHIFYHKQNPNNNSDTAGYDNSRNRDDKGFPSIGNRTPGNSANRRLNSGNASGIRLIGHDQIAVQGDVFAKDAQEEMTQLIKQMGDIMKKNDLANMQSALFQAIRVAGMIQLPLNQPLPKEKNSHPSARQTPPETDKRPSVTANRAIELTRPTAKAGASASVTPKTGAASVLPPLGLGTLTDSNATQQANSTAAAGQSAQSTQRFSSSVSPRLIDTRVADSASVDDEMKSRVSTVTLHHDGGLDTVAESDANSNGRNFV